MTNKRLCKEYKLNINDVFRLKYGTMNRLEPRVVYIEGKCWVGNSEDGDFSDDIKYAMRRFKNSIKTNVLKVNTFDDFLLFDYDISSPIMEHNKKKQLSFSAYIRQKGVLRDAKKLKEEIENIFEPSMGLLEFILSNNGFDATKTKK